MPLEHQQIFEQVRALTMTSPERVDALLESVAYVEARRIPGAFVECGVWRGGSVMSMLLKLQSLGAAERDVYLFDTFEGMTAPTAEDTSSYHPPAQQIWDEAKTQGVRAFDGLFNADSFSEAAVRDSLLKTGYSTERLHFVRGDVLQTIPSGAPEQIALLRLDTDWYESTKHELEHLWSRLADGGVLIIDDYGHWDGCRKAVDEFFGASGKARPVLLNRIDYTGRIAVKA